MVEDGYDLLARDAFEVVQELVDGRAVFESFEKRGDGEPSVLEDPRSANFVRASFDGVATVPVAHGGAFSLRGFDVLGEFSIDTAGMAMDDVVEVECAVGRGHRLYSDRGSFKCPCHWPAAKAVQIARTLQQGSSLALLRRQTSANSSCSSTMVSLM